MTRRILFDLVDEAIVQPSDDESPHQTFDPARHAHIQLPAKIKEGTRSIRNGLDFIQFVPPLISAHAVLGEIVERSPVDDGSAQVAFPMCTVVDRASLCASLWANQRGPGDIKVGHTVEDFS